MGRVFFFFFKGSSAFPQSLWAAAHKRKLTSVKWLLTYTWINTLSNNALLIHKLILLRHTHEAINLHGVRPCSPPCQRIAWDNIGLYRAWPHIRGALCSCSSCVAWNSCLETIQYNLNVLLMSWIRDRSSSVHSGAWLNAVCVMHQLPSKQIYSLDFIVILFSYVI